VNNAGSLEDWIYNTAFVPLASPSVSALLYAMAFAAIMYAFAYFLYRRKWFWKV
jgi:predicted acyltransferase